MEARGWGDTSTSILLLLLFNFLMKSVQTIIRTGKTMGRDTRSERAIFCKFQKSYDQFPVGEIMHVDKPDFIICGERKIGVEITQMFQDQHYQSGSLLKSAEVYKVKVLECLTEFLRNQKTPYCILSIDLDENIFPTSSRPSEIAQICAYDIFKQSENGLKNNLNHFIIDNHGQLPPVIKSYEVLFYPTLNDYIPIETANSIGKVINNENLQFVLNKKEVAKKEFFACDEYWIVIKVGEFASDYYPSIIVNMENVVTSFEKVFILKYLESEVIELK